MKPIDGKEEKVVIRAVSLNEEGQKYVEKTELTTHNVDTVKYVEKKLIDKGVHRMERHPVSGIGIKKPVAKSGHRGKYTWEGPEREADNELDAASPTLDEGDPNYVEEDEEARILVGEKSDVAGLVVGAVDVAKVAGITNPLNILVFVKMML